MTNVTTISTMNDDYMSGEDVALDFNLVGNVAAAPEVSTWAMMLLGFAGLGFVGYRSSRKNAALNV